MESRTAPNEAIKGVMRKGTMRPITVKKGQDRKICDPRV